jgi:hypothetical protein
MWDYLFSKTITLDTIYIYLYVGMARALVPLGAWRFVCLFVCFAGLFCSRRRNHIYSARNVISKYM